MLQTDKLVNVLIVDDDEQDRRLVKIVLARAVNLIKFNVESAQTVTEALEKITGGNFSIILLDLNLPDSKGMETVQKIFEVAPDAPVVVLTGLDDEATGLEAIRSGAMDYLVKGQVSDNILVRTIQYAIERKRMQLALQKAHDELEIKVEERTRELSEANELLEKEIIEREKIEEEMREAMGIKSQFVSMVSHELRTPLTALKEGIRLVVQEKAGKINDEQKELLNLANRNVDRLARLINDVLDLRKLESGKMDLNFQENDINEIVKDIHDIMAPVVKSAGVNFLLELESYLPKVKCDRDKIAQVITNLVNNAIKFTEEGDIIIGTSRKENMIQVSVSDSGCGIKKEDLPKVFREFEQLGPSRDRKTGGTGLGLAISKAIIEQHKGKIFLESEYAKGTTFYFVIPVGEQREKKESDLAAKVEVS